MSSKSKERK